MRPTQDELDRCEGDCDLPRTIDSLSGLSGLLTNTEAKIQHILEGPGSNAYKCILLKQEQTLFYQDARQVVGFQLDGLVEMIGKLGDDQCPVAEYKFNRELIKNGRREKVVRDKGRSILVDGVRYYPSGSVDESYGPTPQ